MFLTDYKTKNLKISFCGFRVLNFNGSLNLAWVAEIFFCVIKTLFPIFFGNNGAFLTLYFCIISDTFTQLSGTFRSVTVTKLGWRVSSSRLLLTKPTVVCKSQSTRKPIYVSENGFIHMENYFNIILFTYW